MMTSKARACDLIYQGLTSCDDRIISALEEIELMLLLDKIENTTHTAEELKKLERAFYSWKWSMLKLRPTKRP